MIVQQILLALNNEGAEVPEPPETVPSGEEFIVELDFPGPLSGITSGVVYTFEQAVRFPIGADGEAFDGSIVTWNGTVITQFNMHIHPADPNNPNDISSADYLDLILTDQVGNEENLVQFFTAGINREWIDAHLSGGDGSPFYQNGFITFYPGEQLYMQYYYGNEGTATDLHIEFIGEAV